VEYKLIYQGTGSTKRFYCWHKQFKQKYVSNTAESEEQKRRNYRGQPFVVTNINVRTVF